MTIYGGFSIVMLVYQRVGFSQEHERKQHDHWNYWKSNVEANELNTPRASPKTLTRSKTFRPHHLMHQELQVLQFCGDWAKSLNYAKTYGVIHCIHIHKALLFWCENQGTRVAGPRSSYPAAGTSDDTGPLPLGGSHGVGSIVESHGCVWKWESSINPPILQFYSFDRETAD